MKHLRLLLLFFMTALFGGNAMAEKTAKGLWFEGQTTLVLVYDEETYSAGDEFSLADETLTISSVTKLTISGSIISKSPWAKTIYQNATRVVFHSSFANARSNQTAYWFKDMEKLTSIENIENLKTDEVKSMLYMFGNCKALTELDVSNFNTAKVEDFEKMFYGCSKLTSLDVSSFSITNVTDLSEMFSGCSLLETIYCAQSADWSNPNISSLNIFNGCKKLSGKYAEEEFMFTTTYNDNTYAKVFTPEQDGYFTYKPNVTVLPDGNPRALWLGDDNVKTLVFVYDENTYEAGVTTYTLNENQSSTITAVYDIDLTKAYSYSGASATPWSGQKTNVETIVFATSFEDARPRNLKCWFYGMTNLAQISGIENLNTKKVTNMSQMFYNCSKLTELDLSNFNTAIVTNMSQMFYNCKNLTELDVSNFNTSLVTGINSGEGMSNMFYGCSGLTKLDLSNFNTAKVVNMKQMFYGCSGLTKLDLSNFNTAKVEIIEGMFYGCSGLTELDLSNFDTRAIMNSTLSNASMKEMFRDCSKLNNLILGPNFCAAKSIQGMFQKCSSLTMLDLSSFSTDLSTVTTMQNLFRDCTNLETIYCAKDADWSTFEPSSNHTPYGVYNVFSNCPKLQGKCGTKAVEVTDYEKANARVCTPDQDGYFTYKGYLGNVTFNSEGYATYASSLPIDFSEAENKGYSAWQITGIAEDGETINFSKITGVVPANTGVLLMGSDPVTLTFATSDAETIDVTGNKLVAFAEAQEIAGDTYYGLSGNEFVKVNAGKVPANKALLPVGDGNVKTLTLVFNDETGIREVRTVSGEQAAEIFNLAGQRLQKAQKGVNIINGKKVLIK